MCVHVCINVFVCICVHAFMCVLTRLQCVAATVNLVVKSMSIHKNGHGTATGRTYGCP